MYQIKQIYPDSNVGMISADCADYTFVYPNIEAPKDSLVYDSKGITIGSTGDADADAWIARLTSPTTLEESSIQTFVEAEKADGNWSLYDEFYLLSLGATNGLVGAKSKTATAFGGVTFDVNGAKFNGTNGEINTNYNFSTDRVNLTDTNAVGTCFVKEHTYTNQFEMPFAAASSSFRFRCPMFISPTEVKLALGSISGSTRTVSNLNSTLWGVGIIGTTKTDYQDGLSLGTDTISFFDISTTAFIGSRNGNYFFPGTVSTALIGAGDGFDHAAHNTNVRQLLTDLGVTL